MSASNCNAYLPEMRGSRVPPYRGGDLRFLSEIEDCDQPSCRSTTMGRDIVHEATGSVRHYINTEGFQQRARSLLVVRRRRDPKAPIRTVRLRYSLRALGDCRADRS